MRSWLHRFSVFGLHLTIVTPLLAQSPSFGFLVGPSLVGGGDSRVLVGSGVTGGDQPGLHLRAFADLPLEASPYVSLGAGLFTTSLGHNPDVLSTTVTETYRGMGFMPLSVGLAF
jgi:hypothetical protein